MLVLDTHAWIWWSHSPDRMSDAAWQACDESDALLVHAIAVWELGMLVSKGRLGLDRDLGDWVRAALTLPGIRLAPLEPRIALRASNLPGDLHGDPADRMIVATAMEYACPLVTRDEALHRYPHVKTVW